MTNPDELERAVTAPLLTSLEQAGEAARIVACHLPIPECPDSVCLPVTITAGDLRLVYAALAASTPVGGWGEPVAWGWRQRMHDSQGGWETMTDRRPPSSWVNAEDVADLHPLYAAPPPPSVSTGSRPQEAVPTEQAGPAVVPGWDQEICTGCTASLSIADIKARGIVSCCPDRHMVRIGDLVDAYTARPPTILPQTEKGS